MHYSYAETVRLELTNAPAFADFASCAHKRSAVLSKRLGCVMEQGVSGCCSVDSTSKVSTRFSADGLDHHVTQPPIGAAMFALMLSVPIEPEAQATRHVVLAKHLDRVRGNLLYIAISAVPGDILTDS